MEVELILAHFPRTSYPFAILNTHVVLACPSTEFSVAVKFSGLTAYTVGVHCTFVATHFVLHNTVREKNHLPRRNKSFRILFQEDSTSCQECTSPYLQGNIYLHVVRATRSFLGTDRYARLVRIATRLVCAHLLVSVAASRHASQNSTSQRSDPKRDRYETQFVNNFDYKLQFIIEP